MRIKSDKLLEDNDQYDFVLDRDKMILIFSWKFVEGLSINDFQKGISKFAAICKEQRPNYAVIDATELDQKSPAVAWLQGSITNEKKEDYTIWWLREIVPTYHDSGIISLAVGTGDPNAPGELPDILPGVKFKIGYFSNVESALQWKVGSPL